MMILKRALATAGALAMLMTGVSELHAAEVEQMIEGVVGPEIDLIAFGSCAKQNKDQPIWDAIVAAKPDVMILLGDNIYGDTEDMFTMRIKYGVFGSKPGYRKLAATTPILAIWDDHDYGVNDGGREYPKKEESKRVFLDFFKEPEASPRWGRPGVYAAYEFGPAERRVQIILLDTRWWRSPLTTGGPTSKADVGPYLPSEDPDQDMLGDAQWTWLEEQLRKPARLRIIGTGIQFVGEFHGYEGWPNLPAERERMLKLITDTGAEGVVIISGDMHYGELMKLEEGTPYPLWEMTSSGLTQTWGAYGVNEHRVGEVIRENNFGLIRVTWGDEPKIEWGLHNVAGEEVLNHSLAMSDLGR